MNVAKVAADSGGTSMSHEHARRLAQLRLRAGHEPSAGLGVGQDPVDTTDAEGMDQVEIAAAAGEPVRATHAHLSQPAGEQLSDRGLRQRPRSSTARRASAPAGASGG